MAQEEKYPEVPVEKLRWRCAPESLPFENTKEIPVCMEIIGQERALKAIRLGLHVDNLLDRRYFSAGQVNTRNLDTTGFNVAQDF